MLIFLKPFWHSSTEAEWTFWSSVRGDQFSL